MQTNKNICFISKSRYGVWTFNIPFNTGNQLQLFMEKFAYLQRQMPQLKSKFDIDEMNEQQYFLVNVWHDGMQSYVGKDFFENVLEYIKANSSEELYS